jgi:hypothetical protein
MKNIETANELYEEVHDDNSETCLIYSTVYVDLEVKFGNSKSKNQIYSLFDPTFLLAMESAKKGDLEKAKQLTNKFDEYKVFHWCHTKEEFAESVGGIFSTLEKHKKSDAYYPCGEGKAVGLQIHIDP